MDRRAAVIPSFSAVFTAKETLMRSNGCSRRTAPGSHKPASPMPGAGPQTPKPPAGRPGGQPIAGRTRNGPDSKAAPVILARTLVCREREPAGWDASAAGELSPRCKPHPPRMAQRMAVATERADLRRNAALRCLPMPNQTAQSRRFCVPRAREQG